MDRLPRAGSPSKTGPSALTTVPHAAVVAAGRTEELTWMVLRRLPGERLDLVWPRLSGREQPPNTRAESEVTRPATGLLALGVAAALYVAGRLHQPD
jgi:hypothetical protein